MSIDGFSNGLKLADLDDFIAPSQECIKPVNSRSKSKNSEKVKGIIEIENFGSGSSREDEKAKITLNDCLACSGCITSAEVILVNQQSIEQLFKILRHNDSTDIEEDKFMVVLSLSTQAVLSIATRYNLCPQDTLERICGYFKSIGVNYVFDLTVASSISLIEASKEFISRFKSKADPGSLPMLSGVCPGFVCYAEKTQGFTLPFISRTKSPQQIMGVLIKKFWCRNVRVKPSKIFHVTLMPCFDKKLESSREQFSMVDFDCKEVDCVLTSIEIEQLLDREKIILNDISPLHLDMDLCLFPKLSAQMGSGSGGYAHHVFTYASKYLFQIDQDNLKWKILKNNDMQEIVLEVDSVVRLRFAVANGFRNIQNLIQKLKRNKCPYDFVEIMACPSGCLNGGAQIRPTEGKSSKELINHMESMYGKLPKISLSDEGKLQTLYSEWFGDDESQKDLKTYYKEIEKNTNPLGIKW